LLKENYLPYALPSIGEEEIAEVVDSLRSGWITTGPKVKRFESEFAAYISTAHAIAVNSCTAGLHIALSALGIGPGDEVIVPTLTFCSTANVVVHLGAKPVLVDVGAQYNLTAEAVKKAITARTKAVLPVHYGGMPCDLMPIYEEADRHSLAVVEDAAHATGAAYRGKKIGSDALQDEFPNLKRAVVFSFYATKNMTTGEGGMVTTADPDLASDIRLLSLHGMDQDAWKRYGKSGSWFYEVTLPGYKYNMTDIQAALGIHQLKKLDSFNERRQSIAATYDKAFTDLRGVLPPWDSSAEGNVFHLYPLLLVPEELNHSRGEFIASLTAAGVGVSVHFIPVHLHPFYQDSLGYRDGDLPNAERFYSRIISLPNYPKMSQQDVERVIDTVHKVCKSSKGTSR
jgi:dTDP-4-amino-4,6-dideoxygalactose transaminase